MILCDTSALLAVFDGSEPRHAASRVVLDAEPGPFVLTPFVVAETDYMVERNAGVDAELAFLSLIADGFFDLVSFGAVDVGRAIGVVERYRDLGIGIADASIVVLAERLATRRIFTLDRRHFAALRPLQGGEFELLPAA